MQRKSQLCVAFCTRKYFFYDSQTMNTFRKIYLTIQELQPVDIAFRIRISNSIISSEPFLQSSTQIHRFHENQIIGKSFIAISCQRKKFRHYCEIIYEDTKKKKIMTILYTRINNIFNVSDDNIFSFFYSFHTIISK